MNEAPRRQRRPRTLREYDENGQPIQPVQSGAPVGMSQTSPTAPQPSVVSGQPVEMSQTVSPPMSAKEAADKRAAEILEHTKGTSDGTDEFFFDRTAIPEGWDYEWKRKSTANQEDPAYQVQLSNAGWTAVPAARHPEMMPSTGHFETIERKGMILMERPLVITDRARMLERRKALEQVRVKEQQLNQPGGPGQFARDAHPQSRPNISKAYEAIPIPKDG